MEKTENILIKNSWINSIAESAPDSIVITNKTGEIILWNKASEQIFGYSKKEALGKSIRIIIPDNFVPQHTKGMSNFISTGEKKIIGSTIELTAKNNKGINLPIELSLSSWQESNQTYFCGIIRNISLRKRNENLLKESIKEKETLLKEVHHRVKNNLQIIISLLKINSQNVPESAKKVFLECQDKIHSMALVHATIYRSDNFSNVNLAEYTSVFCNYFLNVIDSSKIKINTEYTSAIINLDMAINFGLILSELLTNTHKHVSSITSLTEITIKIFKDKDLITLQFWDNGPGISEKIMNNKNTKTYGVQMIKDLVQQMNGVCHIQCEKGTKYNITIPTAN